MAHLQSSGKALFSLHTACNRLLPNTPRYRHPRPQSRTAWQNASASCLQARWSSSPSPREHRPETATGRTDLPPAGLCPAGAGCRAYSRSSRSRQRSPRNCDTACRFTEIALSGIGDWFKLINARLLVHMDLNAVFYYFEHCRTPPASMVSARFLHSLSPFSKKVSISIFKVRF